MMKSILRVKKSESIVRGTGNVSDEEEGRMVKVWLGVEYHSNSFAVPTQAYCRTRDCPFGERASPTLVL